jgi:hypothetical protein
MNEGWATEGPCTAAACDLLCLALHQSCKTLLSGDVCSHLVSQSVIPDEALIQLRPHSHVEHVRLFSLFVTSLTSQTVFQSTFE